MSDPTPRQLPWRPMRAPSPPELPPAVNERLKGLTVVPYRLLDVSKCICSHVYQQIFQARTAFSASCSDYFTEPSAMVTQVSRFGLKANSLLLFRSVPNRTYGFERSIHTNVCGSVVRAWKTQPALRRMSKIRAYSDAAFPTHATKPALYPRSFMPMHSFTLIGRPCKGPTGFLCFAR